MTTPDQIIIYNTDDGHSKVQLLIQDGSAWLTTSQMATLFDVGQHAINHHIREVYKAKELDPSKSKKLLQQAGHDPVFILDNHTRKPWHFRLSAPETPRLTHNLAALSKIK